MTLRERILERFRIGDECKDCKHKGRDCYTQNITLKDLCEVLEEDEKEEVPNNT